MKSSSVMAVVATTAILVPEAQAGFFDFLKKSSLWKSCPETQPMTDFDLNRYLGEWYEMYRRKDNSFQKGQCTLATYSNLTGSDYIEVENSEARINSDGSFAKRSGVMGFGKEFNPGKNDGRLGVKFWWWQPSWASYDVLFTDYDNVALVHSCASWGLWKDEN